MGVTNQGRGFGSDHYRNRITLAVRKAAPATPFLSFYLSSDRFHLTFAHALSCYGTHDPHLTISLRTFA